MAPFVAEGVPVFDIRSAVGMSSMLVETPAVARALALALGAKPAALIRGHGAAVVGPSLPTVVGRSVYLEMNAKLQMQAMTLGGKVTYLDPEEARRAAVIVEPYARAWGVMETEGRQAANRPAMSVGEFEHPCGAGTRACRVDTHVDAWRNSGGSLSEIHERRQKAAPHLPVSLERKSKSRSESGQPSFARSRQYPELPDQYVALCEQSVRESDIRAIHLQAE